MSKTSFLDDLSVANLQEKEKEKENTILNNIKTTLRSTPNIMFHYSDFKKAYVLNLHYFFKFKNSSNIRIIDISDPKCDIQKLINKYDNYNSWVKYNKDYPVFNENHATYTRDYCMFSWGITHNDYSTLSYTKSWEEVIYATDLKLNNQEFHSYVIKEFVALKNKNNIITSFYLHLVLKNREYLKNIIETDMYLLITKISLKDIAKTYPMLLYDHLLKAIRVNDLVKIIIKYVQNINIDNNEYYKENNTTFYL
jgi:hypothetical protein